MPKKNPLQTEAGSTFQQAVDDGTPTRKTTTLQGNAAMRLRLAALIWKRGLRAAPEQVDLAIWGAST